MLTRKLGGLLKSVLSIALVGAIVFVAYSIFYKTEPADPGEAYDHDMVIEDDGLFGYLAVDFGPVILGKAKELAKLEIYEKEATQLETLTDTGFLNIDYLTKIQAAEFCGTAIWTVDFNRFGEKDILTDNSSKTVTIEIPAPEFKVDLDISKTEIGKVEKGKFVPGKIKLAPEDFNKMEKRAKSDMINKIAYDSDDFRNAQNAAVSKVKDIFQPIVDSQADGYEVIVVIKTIDNTAASEQTGGLAA